MFPPPIIDGHLQRRQRHTDQIPGEEGQAPCIRCKVPEKYLKTQVPGYQADIIRQKYPKNQKILPVLSNIHSSRPVLMLRVVKV